MQARMSKTRIVAALLSLSMWPLIPVSAEKTSILHTIAEAGAGVPVVSVCQRCEEAQMSFSSLEVASMVPGTFDKKMSRRVYVVDPTDDVILAYRYSQTSDQHGGTAQTERIEPNPEELRGVQEALAYYHALTEFDQVPISQLDLPEKGYDFDSALSLVGLSSYQPTLANSLSRYFNANHTFLADSVTRIAAYNALMGTFQDALSGPEEDTQVNVAFPNGSSWAFNLKGPATGLNLLNGEASTSYEILPDGGLDAAGNTLHVNKDFLRYADVKGDRRLIQDYVALIQEPMYPTTVKISVNAEALKQEADQYAFVCEPSRKPTCNVRALTGGS